jgi:hypothetical protein
MTLAQSTPELFICGTIVHFKDGGTSEINVLHTGTKEDCELVNKNTHAIAYSGDRPFDHAQCFVMKIDTPKTDTDGATSSRDVTAASERGEG